MTDPCLVNCAKVNAPALFSVDSDQRDTGRLGVHCVRQSCVKFSGFTFSHGNNLVIEREFQDARHQVNPFAPGMTL